MKFKDLQESFNRFERSKYSQTWILGAPEFQGSISALHAFLYQKDPEQKLSQENISALINILNTLQDEYEQHPQTATYEYQLIQDIKASLRTVGISLMRIARIINVPPIHFPEPHLSAPVEANIRAGFQVQSFPLNDIDIHLLPDLSTNQPPQTLTSSTSLPFRRLQEDPRSTAIAENQHFLT